MAGRSGKVPPGNLPALLTSLIGRDGDVAELGRLAARNRLVTLTGVGGVGKTTLAIAVASAIEPKPRNGVWFCDLSAVGDSAMVSMTVASTLDIKEVADRSITDALRRALHASELLIVLDNCEQVLEAAAKLVRELLGACPTLRVIATSREPLEVPGEVVWTVAPLALPEADSQPVGTISRAPAVRLFVERARQARPGFELGVENATAVAAICTRLDGIPLAIELSAARIRMMPPEEILEHLDDRLDLSSRAKTSPGRQRTVRASIDWSYELLDDAERALFRRLAVFSGGFDYEAVKAVCGGGPVPDEPLGILTALVDKSLVAAAPGAAGKGRYRLLETIREYAAARLSENREAAALQEAHARHFLALAEEAAPQFFLGEQVAWMRRLRPEADNFRAALEWSREAQPPVLARLAAALRNFWYMRGQYAEGRQWLGAALEAGIDDAGLRSRVLRQDGMMAWRQGDFMFARHRFEEALELERRGHDQIGLVAALGGLGFVYFGTDDFRAAAPLFEEALALARQSGDQYLLADALQNSGILALQLGNLTEAHTHLTGSLEIFSRTNDVSGVAYTSQLLALVLTQQGDLKGATRLVDQAIKNQAELGDTAGFAGALLSAAELAAAQRRPERAMLLEGAAQQRLRSIGSHLPSLFQASRDRWLAAAQQRLGARVRPLLEKGARLDDEQVARLVLSGADDLAGIAEHGGDEPLSRRELEVAELLASGLTNRQISSKLHLSERTVDAHAEHIRGKLGVRSRAQIAAWVMQRAAPRA